MIALVIYDCIVKHGYIVIYNYIVKYDYIVIYHYIMTYYCNILTFDPAQKCYSKVMHRKEVTHSNGQ